jgi:hypothetical protein
MYGGAHKNGLCFPSSHNVNRNKRMFTVVCGPALPQQRILLAAIAKPIDGSITGKWRAYTVWANDATQTTTDSRSTGEQNETRKEADRREKRFLHLRKTVIATDSEAEPRRARTSRMRQFHERSLSTPGTSRTKFFWLMEAPTVIWRADRSTGVVFGNACLTYSTERTFPLRSICAKKSLDWPL